LVLSLALTSAPTVQGSHELGKSLTSRVSSLPRLHRHIVKVRRHLGWQPPLSAARAKCGEGWVGNSCSLGTAYRASLVGLLF